MRILYLTYMDMFIKLHQRAGIKKLKNKMVIENDIVSESMIIQLEGSISVFHGIIFLCLFAFIFSMVDITRYQMLKLEALSSIKLSGENALSQYDPLLAKQYGLYAGEKGYNVKECMDETIDNTLFLDESDQNTFFVDYLLNNSSDEETGYFSSMQSKFTTAKSTELQLNYIPWIDASFQNPKQQILTYMKQREPYLLIRPFLNSLDFLSKTNRTSKVIEEKNELLSELEGLEGYRVQLMQLIDGIQVKSNQSVQYIDEMNYIRKFYFEEKTLNQFDPEDFTGSTSRDHIDMSTHLQNITNSMTKIDHAIDYLIAYDPYESIEIYPIGEDEPINIGKRLTSDAELRIALIEDLNSKLELEIQFLNQLEQLDKVHEQALAIISTMSTLSTSTLNKINVFESEKLENQDLIESARSEIRNDLDVIKTNISVQDFNLSEVDNLSLIQEQLEANMKLFDAILPTIDLLKKNIDVYVGQRFSLYGESIEYDPDSKDKIIQLMESKFGKPKDTPIDSNSLLTMVSLLSSNLSLYKDNMFLDYRSATRSNPATDTKDSIIQKKNGLLDLNIESLFESKSIIPVLPTSVIDPNSLPSFLLGETSASESRTTIRSFDFTSLLSQAHDSILLNEYIVGMFGNIKKNNDLNSKTINGYSLEDHFFNFEAEYVINGSLDEKENASAVLGYLYGLRMSCNVVHLATNVEKRQIIINLANTIAGWWTGGVGAILIGILIASIWALMESIIDVYLLTSGERVPFIKTESTWYTSIDGDWEKVFNTGVQRIENSVAKQSDILKHNLAELTGELIESIENSTASIIEDHSGNSNSEFQSSAELINVVMNDVGEEMAVQLEIQSNEFEQRLRRFLSELIEQELQIQKSKYQSNQVDLTEIANPFEVNSNEYDLAESMRSEVKKQSLGSFDAGLTVEKSIDFKKTIEFFFESEIKRQKEEFAQRFIDSTTKTVSESIQEIEVASQALVDKGVNLTETFIREKADEIKVKFKKDVVKDSAQDTKRIDFIPTFSYEDYLRLFLMLPVVDERTKIARIMDLIQLNLQKNRDDYALVLKNYFYGVDIKGRLQIDLYFLPEINQYSSLGIKNATLGPVEVCYGD